MSPRLSPSRGHLGRAAATAVTVASLVLTTLMAAPASASSTEPALAPTADTSVWGANGRVMDILPLGDKALIGGGFDYVGPTTGHSALVSGSTGAELGASLMASGEVYASVPDGSGGWFLGGEFGEIGGKYRRGLAHVDADGTVDRTFNAHIAGSVRAIVVVGDRLVIGGRFSKAGGAAATNLAALDLSGNAVPGWSASATKTVFTLATDGTKVYVGGQFTTLNGSSRRFLGRINAADGSLDSAFSGQTFAQVRTIALSPGKDTVYVGGDFTSVSSRFVSSTGRNRLAAFSAAAGDVQSWNPNADNYVRTLTVDPVTGTVYAGGRFTSVGGATRWGFAGLTTGGSATGTDLGLSGARCPHKTKSAYSLNTKCWNEVGAIVLGGGKLLVAGQFGYALGVRRHNAAEIDLSSMTVTPWNPVVGNDVSTALRVGGDVVLGGAFTSFGGLLRDGLALIDLRTGAADPAFRADVDEMVLDLALAPDGQSVYVAGNFKTVAGEDRSKIARVDVHTGALDPKFKAGINNTVIKIEPKGDHVYIGGKFTKVGSTPRLHAARLDATTGTPDTSWTANTKGPSGKLRAGGMVQGLEVAPDGSKVYLAGPFDTVNGTSVTGGIVVVDGSTGAIDPRRLGGVQGCSSVGPWINRLYLTPDGKHLYGGDVCPDYIYQYDAVNLSTASNPTGLNWRAWCNAGMQGALEVNGHFYYGSHGGDKGSGGRCSAYPGGPNVERQRFVVFDADTGRVLDYAPEFDQPMGVWSFAASDYGLLVGGDFTLAGDRNTVAQGFALFRGTP